MTVMQNYCSLILIVWLMRFERKMHMEIFGNAKKQFDFTKNLGDSQHFDETKKKVIQKFKD